MLCVSVPNCPSQTWRVRAARGRGDADQGLALPQLPRRLAVRQEQIRQSLVGSSSCRRGVVSLKIFESDVLYKKKNNLICNKIIFSS